MLFSIHIHICWATRIRSKYNLYIIVWGLVKNAKRLLTAGTQLRGCWMSTQSSIATGYGHGKKHYSPCALSLRTILQYHLETPRQRLCALWTVQSKTSFLSWPTYLSSDKTERGSESFNAAHLIADRKGLTHKSHQPCQHAGSSRPLWRYE